MLFVKSIFIFLLYAVPYLTGYYSRSPKGENTYIKWTLEIVSLFWLTLFFWCATV